MAVIGLHLSLYLNPGDVNHIRVLFLSKMKRTELFDQQGGGKTLFNCHNGESLQPFVVNSSLIPSCQLPGYLAT